MIRPTDKLILSHYEKIADGHQLNPSSTMEDQFIRNSEIEFFVRSIRRYMLEKKKRDLTILDLGCGNGYLLEQLRKEFPEINLYGLEFTPGLAQLAQSREIENCYIINADARDPYFLEKKFDIILSERVIINILIRKEQRQAFREIQQRLKKGGLYLMSESFDENLVQLNLARREMKLEDIVPRQHNLFLNENLIYFMRDRLNIVERSSVMDNNYLSNHFFVTRVTHQVIRPEGGKVKYSHLSRYFKNCYDRTYGNYSPIMFREFIKN